MTLRPTESHRVSMVSVPAEGGSPAYTAVFILSHTWTAAENETARLLRSAAGARVEFSPPVERPDGLWTVVGSIFSLAEAPAEA